MKIFEMKNYELANDHINKVRGGSNGGDKCTKSGTEFETDGNGDGVNDDCHQDLDDSCIELPSKPVVV